MAGPEFSLTKLATYLEQNMPGFRGLMQLEKFPGGQSNPSYKLTAKSGVYVIRRQPFGKLLKSAHAVDREFRVLGSLADSRVPVPSVYHLCRSPDVLGSMFFVMQFCDGRIFWDAALPEAIDNAERNTIYDEMNRVLAELHRVDIQSAGLSDFGKPGNYFSRQLNRWTAQYRASELESIAPMNELITWLERSQPADDGQVTLVHGDYRLDNMVFHHERPEIIAVLDWELSTLGHPLADLAYQCMQLRMSRNSPVPGLGGIIRAELSIPEEQEYVARYCERVNISHIDNWAFYLAFSFFRVAAIIQGVAKRAVEGNASSRDAASLGKWVEPLARMALSVARER